MNEERGHVPLTPDQLGPITPRSAPAAPGRGHRTLWRWLVAFAATMLLVASGAGLAVFAKSGSGAAAGPTFLPAGAPVYLEVRADLPDGQREALAQMLSHFPGFADVASFDSKLDAALDTVVGDASKGALSWTKDVATWFGGTISLGVLGDFGSLMSGEQPHILAALDVTDAAAASAFISTLRELGGSDMAESLTEESYQGANVISGPGMALAVTDDLLLVGTGADEVKTGLDVLAGTTPSLASSETFQSSFGQVPDAHLAAGYVDLSGFGAALEAAMAGPMGGMMGIGGAEASPAPAGSPVPGASTGTSTMGSMAAGMVDMLPTDASFYLAARPDGLTFQAFVSPGPAMPALPVTDASLADAFPAATQVLIEGRNVGETIGRVADMLLGPTVEGDKNVDTVKAILGSPGGAISDLVSWAGDVAVGGAVDANGAWIGAAVQVLDQASATDFVDGLGTLANIVASQDGSTMTVSSAEVAGVTVTTLDLGDMDAQAMALPIEPSISFALADGRFLVGTGSFVADSLGTDEAASLAAAPGFSSALQAVGTSNAGYAYVDINGLRTGLEPMLATKVDNWADIAPYVAPFDRFAASVTSTAGGDLSTTLMLFLR